MLLRSMDFVFQDLLDQLRSELCASERHLKTIEEIATEGSTQDALNTTREMRSLIGMTSILHLSKKNANPSWFR